MGIPTFHMKPTNNVDIVSSIEIRIKPNTATGRHFEAIESILFRDSCRFYTMKLTLL